jgi:hypothetical protein
LNNETAFPVRTQARSKAEILLAEKQWRSLSVSEAAAVARIPGIIADGLHPFLVRGVCVDNTWKTRDDEATGEYTVGLLKDRDVAIIYTSVPDAEPRVWFPTAYVRWPLVLLLKDPPRCIYVNVIRARGSKSPPNIIQIDGR